MARPSTASTYDLRLARWHTNAATAVYLAQDANPGAILKVHAS